MSEDAASLLPEAPPPAGGAEADSSAQGSDACPEETGALPAQRLGKQGNSIGGQGAAKIGGAVQNSGHQRHMTVCPEVRRRHADENEVDAVHASHQQRHQKSGGQHAFSHADTQQQAGAGSGSEDHPGSSQFVGQNLAIEPGGGLDAENLEDGQQNAGENGRGAVQAEALADKGGHPVGHAIAQSALCDDGNHNQTHQ